MSDQQPGSFIPKSPVGSKPTRNRRKVSSSLGMFGIVGILALVVAVSLSAAVYFWKQQTEQNIDQKRETLAEARRAIASSEIEILVSTDKEIETAKQLLSNHVSVVDFFDYVGEIAVKSVQFTGMTLTGTPGNDYTLTVNGEGRDIPSLIVQSNVLADPELLNNVSGAVLSSQGSSINSSDETAGVTFSISGTVNQEMFDFEDSLDNDIDTSLLLRMDDDINFPIDVSESDPLTTAL